MTDDSGRAATQPGSQATPSAADASSPVGADPSREVIYCGFCGKSQHEVRRIIAGPAVFICDQCVDLCGDIIREENRPRTGERGVACPGCGERISMVAAVGVEQRWGIDLKPGPTGLLQAKTVAGTIDGAQRMMRATCLEDGANTQTYVSRLATEDDGTIHIEFVTLPTSKQRKRSDRDRSGEAGETAGLDRRQEPGPQQRHRPNPTTPSQDTTP